MKCNKCFHPLSEVRYGKLDDDNDEIIAYQCLNCGNFYDLNGNRLSFCDKFCPYRL